MKSRWWWRLADRLELWTSFGRRRCCHYCGERTTRVVVYNYKVEAQCDNCWKDILN